MSATSVDTHAETLTTRQALLGRSARRVSNRSGEDSNWAGRWFDLLKESGEFIGMRAGKRTPGAKEPSWIFHSHASYDGLGWLAHLFREEGNAANVSLPLLKESQKPSWFARVAALLRLLARKPHAAATWTSFDVSWRTPTGGAQAGTAVATQYYEADRTSRLAEIASAQGASLNNLLLSALGRACQSQLRGGRAHWMVPVNMRGPVSMGSDTANHTAYLQIELCRDDTASQVHERVKEALRKREHWGAWLFLNSGRLIGYAGMRWIFRRELARTAGRPWTGAFSNLGSWNGVGEWLVCPPVAATCPLGVGVIICDGKLSLTIDAHPSIARGPAWTRALMDRWVTELGV